MVTILLSPGKNYQKPNMNGTSWNMYLPLCTYILSWLGLVFRLTRCTVVVLCLLVANPMRKHASFLNFSWARIWECLFVCVCPNTLGQSGDFKNGRILLKFCTLVPRVNIWGFFSFFVFSKVVIFWALGRFFHYCCEWNSWQNLKLSPVRCERSTFV